MLLPPKSVADAVEAKPSVKPATQNAPRTRLSIGCFKISSISLIIQVQDCILYLCHAPKSSTLHVVRLNLSLSTMSHETFSPNTKARVGPQKNIDTNQRSFANSQKNARSSSINSTSGLPSLALPQEEIYGQTESKKKHVQTRPTPASACACSPVAPYARPNRQPTPAPPSAPAASPECRRTSG